MKDHKFLLCNAVVVPLGPFCDILMPQISCVYWLTRIVFDFFLCAGLFRTDDEATSGIGREGSLSKRLVCHEDGNKPVRIYILII